MKRVLAITIVLSLALGLAACGPLAAPSVDDIVARMAASSEQQQHMHMVMETIVTSPQSESWTMVMETWTHGRGQYRTEYLEGSDEMAGTLFILNGDRMWTFNPQDNTYTEIEVPTPADGGFVSDPSKMQDSMRTAVAQMIATVDIAFLGSEEMAGRKVYKLGVKPKPDQPESGFLFPSGTGRLWVDAETWGILGLELEIDSGERMSQRTRQIEYNPDFPDDLFRFVPPEGATRLEAPGPETARSFADLEALQAAATIPVLTPSELPEGFTFQHGSISSPRVEGEGVPLLIVTQIYQTEDKQLFIYQAQMPAGAARPPAMDAPDVVEVRGHEAVVMDMGPGGRQVTWLEGPMEISVSGQVDREVLLQIAQSLR